MAERAICYKGTRSFARLFAAGAREKASTPSARTEREMAMIE